MSRSYKRTPGWVAKSRSGQKMAARRVRRLPVEHEIPDGSAYKRCYPQWDVIDHTYLLYNKKQLDDWVEWEVGFYTDSPEFSKKYLHTFYSDDPVKMRKQIRHRCSYK